MKKTTVKKLRNKFRILKQEHKRLRLIFDNEEDKPDFDRVSKIVFSEFDKKIKDDQRIGVKNIKLSLVRYCKKNEISLDEEKSHIFSIPREFMDTMNKLILDAERSSHAFSASIKAAQKFIGITNIVMDLTMCQLKLLEYFKKKD